MSNSNSAAPVAIPTRDAELGRGMRIRRALPNRGKRLIGAWCFLDHVGPVDVSEGDGLSVGPHPHTGLQTFTWMVEGEILHRDSLGYEQIIRPGQVNLMTAGHGISHSETSPAQRPKNIHVAQLWIALPDALRNMDPAFEHYPELPRQEHDGFSLTLLAGELLGERSPVRVHSPLFGTDISAVGGTRTVMPLRPEFEYGLLVLSGEVQAAGQTLVPGALLDLGSGRDSLPLACGDAARCLLLGGQPFGEEVLLWWNFVGRTRAEIESYTADWQAGRRFGTVPGGMQRLVAPPVPEGLRAGG
ncbi:MAG: pirin family protein [Rhodocyclaceae bacterium]|nr:pirin family protein [Rhodocyclaceae bacterium]MBX3669730.1 pirin family protein [Rhodocyclaceae bacterium]